MKDIHIFTGHYGSGKTEISINFAMAERKKGKDVTIIDLDTVNPYFRTNDVRGILEANGIKVIAGRFASSNVDMPIVPAEVLGVFNGDGCAVFDVGGDDEGAYALGQYADYFAKSGYSMHFVVNTKRPLTVTAEELFQMALEIERASRLRFTDIFNNTNLSVQTDADTLMSSADELERLEQLMGVRVAKHCGTEASLQNINSSMSFPMRIYLKMPF